MRKLDDQWLSAKREYDRLARLYGPRSERAKAAQSVMMEITARILRRDNRRRAA